MARMRFATLCTLLFVTLILSPAQEPGEIGALYTKTAYRIPMRDGVSLYTVVYTPKDTSALHPIMLNRTPYGVAPYDSGSFPASLGPSRAFLKENYIYAYQDVRGRMMSEGEYVNVRPYRATKHSPLDIDETSDTYDTIDWLVKHVRHNNGRVGMWGISYPGFYAAMGMIDAHPALKAVSPQAPIADWFAGDDFHHNGAFFLLDALGFYSSFGRPRSGPTTEHPKGIDFGPTGIFQFFRDLGPLANANTRYLHDSVAFWNDLMNHGTYDAFWRERVTLPHFHNVKPAVLVVGGWFDAEDLYGTLRTYQANEKQSPAGVNNLVMGPWQHGGWARTSGEHLGETHFGSTTSRYYQENVELPFFNHYLKDGPDPNLPEALVFETGTNTWRSYAHWPPKASHQQSLFFNQSGGIEFQSQRVRRGHDEYVSDPAQPVPYSGTAKTARGVEYMVEDQHFAGMRADVRTYQTAPLTSDVTVAGPITADLYVSTTGTDADYVVKLIDVRPDSAATEMLVRAEIMRGKFRNSLEKPEPMIPGKVTRITWRLSDASHCFKAGHRIMVQVQSSWFPLVDLNPQSFVNIYRATERDFHAARQTIYRGGKTPSRIILTVPE